MNIQFNIEQVLIMAERIEKNTVNYYQNAAAAVEAPEQKAFLNRMVQIESQHESDFAHMRSQLTQQEKESTAFDPENHYIQYCQNHADMQKLNEQPVDFTDIGSIIRGAIEHEKEAILFYLGMKAYIPERLGKEKIDDIISEEMSHINILQEHYKVLAV